MAASKYLGANLDVGHYTEAGYDPVPFLEQHHERITNLHLKDMKKATNGGGYTPVGSGRRAAQSGPKLVQKNKWDIPVNIEFEYQGDPLVEVPQVPRLRKGGAGLICHPRRRVIVAQSSRKRLAATRPDAVRFRQRIRSGGATDGDRKAGRARIGSVLFNGKDPAGWTNIGKEKWESRGRDAARSGGITRE